MSEEYSEELIHILMNHIQYLERRLVNAEEVLRKLDSGLDHDAENLSGKHMLKYGGHYVFTYLGEE